MIDKVMKDADRRMGELKQQYKKDVEKLTGRKV